MFLILLFVLVCFPKCVSLFLYICIFIHIHVIYHISTMMPHTYIIIIHYIHIYICIYYKYLYIVSCHISVYTIIRRLPSGVIAGRSGTTMAAADFFDFRVHGVGAHGAMPHLGVDPVTATAAVTRWRWENVGRTMGKMGK